jgi:hypothetical protein
MRRHFGSRAAGLCACDGILKANFRRNGRSRMAAAVDPASAGRYAFGRNLPLDRAAHNKAENLRG